MINAALPDPWTASTPPIYLGPIVGTSIAVIVPITVVHR
jgi:hypothetical protein